MDRRMYVFFLVFVSITLFSATISWSAKPPPVCGDGKCRGDEAITCPQDCPAASVCGDGSCDGDENAETCAEDCFEPPTGTCNYDGTCNAGEDCISCPADCAGVSGGKPSGRYCCGADSFCDSAYCGSDCGIPAEPYCGDGNIDTGEECDDAGESTFCDTDCTYSICGDATLNSTSGEQCDDGVESVSCDIDCTEVECGDGTLNITAGEECDDGNTLPDDGCSATCVVETQPEPYCGDGIVNQESEQCDDGNTTPLDGCDADCQFEQAPAMVPLNQFNIGDSIGEAEAADGTIGSKNHQTVWSTGFASTDDVYSLNEQFENLNSSTYEENNADRDPLFNHAVSGAVMADFVSQAIEIVNEAGVSTSGEAGMVTVLLGNNDVCAPLDMNDTPLIPSKLMTDPVEFEMSFRAGLDILASSELTRNAHIHVSSIPAIYWLWVAKRSNFWCRVFVWPNVPCENLLYNPVNDCADDASILTPDTIYPGDGPNCTRRKEFHMAIRDTYNPILQDVLQEYKASGTLPNADYVDIFNVYFGPNDVNSGDCFHPSESGHALMADEEWWQSKWGN